MKKFYNLEVSLYKAYFFMYNEVSNNVTIYDAH